MVYVKQVWANSPSTISPISGPRLNKLETQYDEAVSYVNQITVTADFFGAKGDGVADDTAAIQAAVDALPFGGTITFRAGATYKLNGAVLLGSDITIEGNGATVIKTGSATGHTTFANKMYAIGYGGGGKNITLRNLKTRGDYSLGLAAYRDVTANFMHVSGLRVENCSFEQGMINGHYLDLQGCDNIRVVNCTFRGMNPLSGREFIEAIQVDSATLSGAGHSYFGEGFYDGLPTRNLRVTGCTFLPITLGGTEYPMAKPLGTHGGALIGDDGWYQDIWFDNNLVRGWMPDLAGNYWQGWIQLPGARNVSVSGNTFAYTGPSRGAGRGSVVSSRPLATVIPLSDVGSSSASTVTLSSPRGAVNWDISNNIFTGFATNFADSASSVIYMDASTNDRISVIGNSSDAAKAGFCRIDSDLNLVVSNNNVDSSGTNASIDLRSCSAVVEGNSIRSSAIGVFLSGGLNHVVTGNRVTGGSNSLRVVGVSNPSISNNLFRDYTSVGIELGLAADATVTQDALIAGNRLVTSSGSASSIRIGTKSTGAFRYGNLCRGGGAISDTGSGSISNSALDQTA